MPMRRVPTHCGRRPTVAARTRLAAVGFQQVGGADIGFEPAGDQRHDVHQRFGRLGAVFGEAGDFFEGEDALGLTNDWLLGHWFDFALGLSDLQILRRHRALRNPVFRSMIMTAKARGTNTECGGFKKQM